MVACSSSFRYRAALRRASSVRRCPGPHEYLACSAPHGLCGHPRRRSFRRGPGGSVRSVPYRGRLVTIVRGPWRRGKSTGRSTHRPGSGPGRSARPRSRLCGRRCNRRSLEFVVEFRCRKYAEAVFRISSARRNSRLSRSSSAMRFASSVVLPRRTPPSISTCRTRVRRVS